jgi:hypothetical protein
VVVGVLLFVLFEFVVVTVCELVGGFEDCWSLVVALDPPPPQDIASIITRIATTAMKYAPVFIDMSPFTAMRLQKYFLLVIES